MAIVSVTMTTRKLTTLICIDQIRLISAARNSNPPFFFLPLFQTGLLLHFRFAPGVLSFASRAPPLKPNRVPSERGAALSSIDVRTDLYWQAARSSRCRAALKRSAVQRVKMKTKNTFWTKPGGRGLSLGHLYKCVGILLLICTICQRV